MLKWKVSIIWAARSTRLTLALRSVSVYQVITLYSLKDALKTIDNQPLRDHTSTDRFFIIFIFNFFFHSLQQIWSPPCANKFSVSNSIISSSLVKAVNQRALLMESQKQTEISEENKSQKIVCDDHVKSDLSGDYGNIAILLLLYLLQGIPLGITLAIPILLQNKGVSYKEQAAFSLAFYPFSGTRKC